MIFKYTFVREEEDARYILGRVLVARDREGLDEKGNDGISP